MHEKGSFCSSVVVQDFRLLFSSLTGPHKNSRRSSVVNSSPEDGGINHKGRLDSKSRAVTLTERLKKLWGMAAKNPGIARLGPQKFSFGGFGELTK